jgi:hypothetical protein
MALVSGIISKTLTGSNVTDALPGGSTGYDFGVSTTDKNTTPVNTIFFSHNGANSITNVGYYLGTYVGTYGGDYSTNSDYNKVIEHGNLGDYGLQIEESYSNGTPFNGSYVIVKTGTADTYSNRRTVQTTSILRNNGGVEASPSAPVAGSLGTTGNTTLGDRVKLRCRYVVPSSGQQLGGNRQVSIIFTFNYTT